VDGLQLRQLLEVPGQPGHPSGRRLLGPKLGQRAEPGDPRTLATITMQGWG
jgi:hypothetical protein